MLDLRHSFAIRMIAAASFSAAAGASLPTLSQAAPVVIETEAAAPGFADIVEKVSTAVASVRVDAPEPPSKDSLKIPGVRGLESLPKDHPLQPFLKEFMESQRKARPRGIAAQGSGFFVSSDGMLVTNNHVIESGGDITVVLDDGTELAATLVGADERTDLAVLKVEADREFTYVGFADDAKVRVGDWVVAVGNPFGLGGSVTAGIVSARGRDIGAGPYDDFLQIDAAINRGNSGGPAFNHRGEVVGVNTAIYSPSGGNVGIAFAIPASTVKRVVEGLIEHGSVFRGWLGVHIQPVTPEAAESLGMEKAAGALVVSVLKDSPAAKAGLASGDIVLSVDGKPIAGPRELSMTVASMSPDTDARLAVWSKGKEKTVTVKLGQLPEDAKAGKPAVQDKDEGAEALREFGIEAAPAEDGDGLSVSSVQPDGIAAVAGIAAGDRIVSVNTDPVSDTAGFAAAISKAREAGRKAALLMVEKPDGPRYIAIPLP